MNRHVILAAFIFFMVCVSSCAQKENNVGNSRIKISAEWIHQLRNYDYQQDNSSLLRQFEKYISPDSLAGSQENIHTAFINPMFVDIDNDGNEELIGLLGWNESEPTLFVSKMIENDWYLIYYESFNVYYYSPELQVANNFSANKTFYIRWLYHRGSGIYCDAYHFYKLIDNKVYPCLDLVNSAHVSGWGLYLHQKVEMSFKFNSANADGLWVYYNYSFSPGVVCEDDVSWENHDDISFVKGGNGLNYYWDSTTFSYQPQIYNRQDALTEEKIACFGAFGNDTLFVKAFQYEINETLEKGTAEQKRVLQKYLDIVKSENK